MFEFSGLLTSNDGDMISISMSVAFEQFDEAISKPLVQILSSQDEKGMIIELQFILELNLVE